VSVQQHPVFQSLTVSSAVGNAIVFPLDLATTRLQHARPDLNKKGEWLPIDQRSFSVSLIRTLQLLTRRKGLASLFDGLTADTLSTILSSFLYFFFYSTAVKAMITRRLRSSISVPDGSKPTPLGAWEELLIGLVAGVASKGVTLPISAVSVRQRLGDEEGNAAGLVDTFKRMLSEDGLSGMFAALPPSIPLALLPSLTLYIHSVLLRRLLPNRHQAHPPGGVTFALGAVSNALATIPLYPLVLIKALSQSGADNKKGKSKARNGVVTTASRIMEQEGVVGLYKGLEGQLVKGLVSQGVMMLVKQR
jgi:adenine nucleotide transporter 17